MRMEAGRYKSRKPAGGSEASRTAGVHVYKRSEGQKRTCGDAMDQTRPDSLEKQVCSKYPTTRILGM